jgi:hypothetical protein
MHGGRRWDNGGGWDVVFDPHCDRFELRRRLAACSLTTRCVIDFAVQVADALRDHSGWDFSDAIL